MRRLLALGLLLGLTTVLLVGAKAGGTGQPLYRVDAIFDRTAALIPGQKVKVAGAPVGSVSDIKLTRDRKARVQMEVEEGFAPFRADARCTIRAEALIGEKFVQCDPGTPGARELASRDGEAPTVPLAHNTAPVEIDTILSTFRRPYRERLRILLSEFGIGLAGRSDDLDELIRRSNPALREANRLLRILDREKRSLGRLIDGSDAALAELAGRREQVKSVIDRAASVTEATASRRDDLSEAIRRLPPLLAEVEPSANRLSAFARQATPAVRDLRRAAPAVNKLLGDVAPLTDAAVPALQRLSRTSRIGRRAVKAALPVARRLQLATRELPDVVRTANRVVESLQDQGGIENLLGLIYHLTVVNARYDAVSHIFPAFAIFNQCSIYSDTPQRSCNGHFANSKIALAGKPAGRTRSPRPARGTHPSPEAQGLRPKAPSTRPQRPAGPARPLLPLPLPQLPKPGERPTTGIPLLDWLLR